MLRIKEMLIRIWQKITGFPKTWKGESKRFRVPYLRKYYDNGYRFFIIDEKCFGIVKIFFFRDFVLLLIPEKRKKDLHTVIRIDEIAFWEVYETEVRLWYNGHARVAATIRMTDFETKGTVLHTQASLDQTARLFKPPCALSVINKP